MNPPPLLLVAALMMAGVMVLVGCSGAIAEREAGPAVSQPAPQTESVVATSTVPARLGHTDADVRFMQHMIVHHAQALEMARLVPDRSERQDVRMLARRIEVSQADEIAMMRRWLTARGEDAPHDAPYGDHSPPDEHRVHDSHGHPPGNHDQHAAAAPHEGMPGMLTPEQLARLAQASGEEFDRLFLEYMIFHHEGAILMVEELFAAEGGGQDTDIFQIASHIDSDQRAEILRMRRMLSAPPQRDTE